MLVQGHNNLANMAMGSLDVLTSSRNGQFSKEKCSLNVNAKCFIPLNKRIRKGQHVSKQIFKVHTNVKRGGAKLKHEKTSQGTSMKQILNQIDLPQQMNYQISQKEQENFIPEINEELGHT